MIKCTGHPESLDRRPHTEDSKIPGYRLFHEPKTGGGKVTRLSVHPTAVPRILMVQRHLYPCKAWVSRAIERGGLFGVGTNQLGS